MGAPPLVAKHSFPRHGAGGAAALAFFDIFWLCAFLSAALVVLVLLMKRSVAEKGEHIGAE